MTTTANPALAAGHDDLGTGDPTLLLLPGWCGGREVFDPILRPLAIAHRVISADLRGQGGRRHHTEDFDSATQVDDLVALVEQSGADRVLPVALAHAGWLAIELRRRLGPDRVPGIVLIDWMPLGTPPGFTDALAGLQSPAWAEVRAALFGMWTAGLEHPDVLEYVASMATYGEAHWSRAGREIAAAFEREGTPLAALDAIAQDTPCPTLHLYAQPADPAYLDAQRAAAADRPWFRPVRLEASSHFPPLEIPADVCSAITAFVAPLA